MTYSKNEPVCKLDSLYVNMFNYVHVCVNMCAPVRVGLHAAEDSC